MDIRWVTNSTTKIRLMTEFSNKGDPGDTDKKNKTALMILVGLGDKLENLEVKRKKKGSMRTKFSWNLTLKIAKGSLYRVSFKHYTII